MLSRISLQRIGGVLMGDEAGGAVRPWPPSCAPGQPPEQRKACCPKSINDA
jgi:hypothetical protein